MNKVLILASDYMSNASANGICTRNIAKELSKRGYEVIILSDSEKDGLLLSERNITVYGVHKTLFARVLSVLEGKNKIFSVILFLIRCIRGGFVFISFPNSSPVRAIRMYKAAKKICIEQNVNMVIATYRPYEAIKTALKLKKNTKNERIFVCLYHLDLLSSPNTSSKLLREYKVRKAKRSFGEEIAIANLVLLPKSAKSLGINSKKVDYVDFPLYQLDIKKDEDSDFEFDKSYINIVYIGTIDGRNREINYIRDLINKINNKKMKKYVMLHIWGNITDFETTNVITESKYIQYHGCIDNKHTNGIYMKCDFCLNLSNKITYNMVPSKIFQLFSVGKPIINVVEHPDDASLGYFELNDYTLRLDAYMNSSKDENKLLEFINEWENKVVHKDDSIYYESTPEYIVNRIIGSDSE